MHEKKTIVLISFLNNKINFLKKINKSVHNLKWQYEF